MNNFCDEYESLLNRIKEVDREIEESLLPAYGWTYICGGPVKNIWWKKHGDTVFMCDRNTAINIEMVGGFDEKISV